MWLWWIVSLVVLVISILFASRVFITSRKLRKLVSYGDSLTGNKSESHKPFFHATITNKGQEISELRSRLRALELSSNENNQQLTRLNDRLLRVERTKFTKKTSDERLPDQELQQLHLALLDRNTQLENELEITKQNLELSEQRFLEVGNDHKQAALQQSIADQQLYELKQQQNTINLLEQKLIGAMERENELRTQQAEEEYLKEELAQVKSKYLDLKSEAGELRNRIAELNKRDALLSFKLNQLSEMNSRLKNPGSERSEFQKKVT